MRTEEPAVSSKLSSFHAQYEVSGLVLHPLGRCLEGAGAEQEIDNVALMWLEPVQLDGRDRPDVQAIDVRGLEQLLAPHRVVSDRAAYQRLADFLDHFR